MLQLSIVARRAAFSNGWLGNPELHPHGPRLHLRILQADQRKG